MQTVKMLYIVQAGVLIAIMAREADAHYLVNKIGGEILTLNTLLEKSSEQKVVIPESFSWVVNSDKRHHETLEREKGEANITGVNALSFMTLKYANPEKTLVKHPTEDYSVGVEYAKSQWSTAIFE